MAGVEDGLREVEEVWNVGEEAGVACGAVKDGGVFILDFALDNAMTEPYVLLGGRNSGALGREWAEARCGHGERGKDFPVCPLGEGFVYEDFEGFAEEDKSGIGVFGACAGRNFDAEFETSTKQGKRCEVLLEQANVSGQTGGVREEMMDADVTRECAWLTANDKAREEFAEGHLEIEETALVEEHGRGGGDGYFGDAGDVVDCVRGDGGRT